MGVLESLSHLRVDLSTRATWDDCFLLLDDKNGLKNDFYNQETKIPILLHNA